MHRGELPPLYQTKVFFKINVSASPTQGAKRVVNEPSIAPIASETRRKQLQSKSLSISYLNALGLESIAGGGVVSFVFYESKQSA